jgi:hypothetical protein
MANANSLKCRLTASRIVRPEAEVSLATPAEEQKSARGFLPRGVPQWLGGLHETTADRLQVSEDNTGGALANTPGKFDFGQQPLNHVAGCDN